MTWLGRVLRILITLPVLALVALAVLWALAHNEAATLRALPLIPGVKVVGPSGALLGDFKARRIDIALPRNGRLTLVDPAWQALRLWPDASASWHLGVKADAVSVRRLELMWVAGPPGKPTSGPPDVALPLSVDVARLDMQEARSNLLGELPLTGVLAAIQLQAASPQGKGAVHHVTLHQLTWHGWALSGDAQLGLAGKMPLTAHVKAQGGAGAAAPDAEGTADLALQGPLAHLQLQGSVAWQRPKEARQTLRIDSELTPFDAWPLPKLIARADGLNLANLMPSLPITALSGQVSVEPQATQDLVARLQLRNEKAGVWDAQSLPVLALQGQLSLIGARAAKDMNAVLQGGMLDLAAQLPTVGKGSGAALTLKGGWGASRSLMAEWRGLEPQALYSLAPPLQLQGRLQVKPVWRAGLSDVMRIPAVLDGQVQGVYAPDLAQDKPKPGGGWRPAGRQPVSLKLDARYEPGALAVSQLLLQSGTAQAEVRETRVQWREPSVASSAEPADGQPAWQLKGKARINDFDPQIWLPWPADVKGRNQLTGQFDVAVDANWRGQIDAHIAPSQLGGLPVHADMQWRSPLKQNRMQLTLDVDAAGNTLRGQATLPWQPGPDGALGSVRWGTDAQWQAAVKAPSLQSLQSVAPLLGARQVNGVVEAEGQAQGMWPNLLSSGKASVSNLQWVLASGTALKLASAKADWSVDTRTPDAPTRLKLDAQQGLAGDVRLDQAVAALDGSMRAHTLRLTADVVRQHKQAKPMPVHMSLATRGSWQQSPDRTSSGWQGHFSELIVHLVDESAKPLVQAQPFDLSWHQDAQMQQLQISPTSLSVLGAAVRLRQFNWQTGQTDKGADDAAGQTEIDAELAPLNLAAVLASWQPDAGWGGDLLLVGKAHLHHSKSQPWVVDAEVARQSGDLSLSEPTIEGHVEQRLGIRQARLTLQARDGVWTLQELFDGRITGLLKGHQVVQARSPDALPAASDPLSGELDMQIGNLRPWGSWVPAGWRLSGQMQAQAKVTGTLGVPNYVGQINGQNLGLGQALLGVNLTDGTLQVDMQGDRVRLTKFTAKSGGPVGSMSAQGQAVLSENPEMTLSVQADHFAILQRVDRRIVISGQAKASFDAETINLDGTVGVDEGLIDISKSDAPTIGDDVNVLNRQNEEAQDQAPGAAGTKRKVNTTLSVDLGQKLKLKGHGLDAFLTGALRVSTPNNQPAIKGTVKAENGTYAAYGQKLVIERGTITFTGAIENPRLDILAMRAQSPTASDSDVKVGVNITGTAQDPRVSLYSDPAMSETEKLSWLVLGRAPTGLGGADIGLLQSAAVALLSGEGGSPSDNVMGKLGLDTLSVRQTDDAVHDTVVALGKQVSKYWYVGYERNITATSGNWQLIYRLAQRVTVRTQAGDDNAIDFIWAWRWD
ncbi:MAG: translocation/assembly module TamB domain-containing protein [Aquabacterium sp.]